ncbi:MAG: hypothetical protein U0521_01795 [Anaerolineae bacterium]
MPITVYAAAHFYHAFDQSGQTEQTTVILTFERGYVTLREWVPTSIEILTPVSAEMLQPFLPGKVEVSIRDDGRAPAYACAPEGKNRALSLPVFRRDAPISPARSTIPRTRSA